MCYVDLVRLGAFGAEEGPNTYILYAGWRDSSCSVQLKIDTLSLYQLISHRKGSSLSVKEETLDSLKATTTLPQSDQTRWANCPGCFFHDLFLKPMNLGQPLCPLLCARSFISNCSEQPLEGIRIFPSIVSTFPSQSHQIASPPEPRMSLDCLPSRLFSQRT